MFKDDVTLHHPEINTNSKEILLQTSYYTFTDRILTKYIYTNGQKLKLNFKKF